MRSRRYVWELSRSKPLRPTTEAAKVYYSQQELTFVYFFYVNRTGGEIPASFADAFALSWTTFSTVSSKSGKWILVLVVSTSYAIRR